MENKTEGQKALEKRKKNQLIGVGIGFGLVVLAGFIAWKWTSKK